MVADGVKDLHNEHLLVHANIYNYRSRGVKGQIFFNLLMWVGYSSTTL